jgi:hypothetical protein
MSHLGNRSAGFSGATLIFDDAGASLLGDGPWFPAFTHRPKALAIKWFFRPIRLLRRPPWSQQATRT